MIDKPAFRGEGYDIPLDHKRLSSQNGRVLSAMLDHQWHTLGELEDIVRAPQASISAQLRHLKRAPFGSWKVEKQRRGVPTDGLWEYRIPAPPKPVQGDLFAKWIRLEARKEGLKGKYA